MMEFTSNLINIRNVRVARNRAERSGHCSVLVGFLLSRICQDYCNCRNSHAYFRELELTYESSTFGFGNVGGPEGTHSYDPNVCLYKMCFPMVCMLVSITFLSTVEN